MLSRFSRKIVSYSLTLGSLSILTSLGLGYFASTYNTAPISPEAVRAYALRREINQILVTEGTPTDSLADLRREYDNINQHPEHRKGLEILIFRDHLHDFSAITGVSGLLFLLVGGLLQRQHLRRYQTTFAAHRLAQQITPESRAACLLDPELREPDPPRRYTLKKLK